MNYERVNWEDGTLQTGAYVEIDGTQYPVTMPTYSCNTPITATNLNIMDKGISDLIHTEDVVLRDTNWELLGTLHFTRVGNLVHVNGNLSYSGHVVQTGDMEHLVGALDNFYSVAMIGEKYQPKNKEYFSAITSAGNNKVLRMAFSNNNNYTVLDLFSSSFPLSRDEIVYINTVYELDNTI